MPDSRLNGAERSVQQSFRKSQIFNGLILFSTLLAAYLPIRALPDRKSRPAVLVPLSYRLVSLSAAGGPLRLAGAWELEAGDRRFGGLSALALDRGQMLSVSDRGAVVRFDLPSARRPTAWIADLRAGPGPWGKKWSRDAESLARDDRGRGWWVGFEQNHSLWLYDPSFGKALASAGVPKLGWRDNRGAEGLLVTDGRLLALGENGRHAVRFAPGESNALELQAGADIADAAAGPDGSAWLLLRSKRLGGIRQSIAPLIRTRGGYRAGSGLVVPKGRFDNFEGMTIEKLPGGNWRFWLLTDDGHRIMARTLLVALDYAPPRHKKSPAQRAGPSRTSERKKR